MADIYGTPGNDSWTNDNTNDRYFGGDGNDTMRGGDGTEVLFPGSNPAANGEWIYGGNGHDLYYGNGGNDVLNEQPTHTGNDTMYGGNGDDTLTSSLGDDLLHGDAGNDHIVAGSGNDTLYGGTGDDILYGGDGNDSLYGDDGEDSLVGGNGEDSLVGGEGNDIIWGEEGNDSLWGGDGDDTLSGGGGDDSLFGGEGQDHLRGGDGHDTLWGGDGHDSLWGDAGNDLLNGGAGNDRLSSAGGGSDTLTGGSGDDLFLISGGAGDVVMITDLGAGETAGSNGTNTDNDFVDLTPWYNASTLAAYNAAYGQSFTNALQALAHDGADGTLDWIAAQGGPTVHITTTGTGALDEEHTGVTCFTAGTLIATDGGEVAIEALEQGDLVLTRDDGFQPVRWIGKARLEAADLRAQPHLRPIRIAAGALGNGLPSADLLVSPQHRVLVVSTVAERMFGEREVLVAAKHLTALPGIEVAGDGNGVEYWHFLLDRHQVVFSNGAPTESLYTGPQALRSVPAESREEILSIFPQLADLDHAALPDPARLLVPGRRARRFAARIAANGKRLVA